jgi:Ankyrin repeats (3 copies)
MGTFVGATVGIVSSGRVLSLGHAPHFQLIDDLNNPILHGSEHTPLGVIMCSTVPAMNKRVQAQQVGNCQVLDGNGRRGRSCHVNMSTTGGDNAPLHIACQHGKLEVVKYLVETAGADIFVLNAAGYTPLYVACDKGCMDVVVYLAGLLPAV